MARFLGSPSSNSTDAFDILESNSVLTENIAVARAVGDLCAISLEALELFESRKSADPNWVSRQPKAANGHAVAR